MEDSSERDLIRITEVNFGNFKKFMGLEIFLVLFSFLFLLYYKHNEILILHNLLLLYFK